MLDENTEERGPIENSAIEENKEVIKEVSSNEEVKPKVDCIEGVNMLKDEPKDGTEINTTSDDEVLNEIDETNAEDAEDTDNSKRHEIPFLEYDSMSLENLVGELQRLVKNEKVQAIKKHVDAIKTEFDVQFQDLIEAKKEEFIEAGGVEMDFKFTSVSKRQFNEVYQEYREKRNQYHKNLEKNLNDNLAIRLGVIEELKGLINVEEDINTTYQNFKNLQEQWRNAGPIPRDNYNNVWRTYHHHIEIFYDFLHLNRELRDLDFKHNLEEKEKLATQAESLAKNPDLNTAFRELQTLHKIWKEEIGPVAKEHREAIWQRFSNATKVLHQRKQDHYAALELQYEKNLEVKNDIIATIDKIANDVSSNHKQLQKQIKQIETLRDLFFKAGKVPQKVNEKTWASFKSSVKAFNLQKNVFYKNLKKEQQDNLDKKRALLEIAINLKDSDDWDSATQEFKRIQNEWKGIGHVPRRHSDKIWKQFKDSCNHYFDRLNVSKNGEREEENDNYNLKVAFLEKVSSFELSGTREADLTQVKAFINEWKTFGRVPFKKKNINQKFNKILDGLFKKLDVNRQESELLIYGNKLQELAKADDEYAINNERTFIRRKISEAKDELRQLENNMQFFSNASEDSPIVKNVLKNIKTHQDALATWSAKLKKLNILNNKLAKDAEGGASEEE